MKEIFVFIIWPLLAIIIYLIGRHFSAKKRIKSSIFFVSFLALSYIFLIFLAIIAPPPSLPKSLDVEVVSVNGMEGFVMIVDADDFGKIKVPPFNVTIKVIEPFNNKPISGATVVISGAETVATGKTGEEGVVILYIKNAILEENIQQEDMSIEVTAQGYFRYVNKEGIKLVRI